MENEKTKTAVKKKTVEKAETVAKVRAYTKKPSKTATVKSPKTAAVKTSEEILNMILKDLEDGKAQDIVTIPLAGKTGIADYMVIASGSSSRQVAALAENIAFNLKKAKIKNSLEGKSGGQWVIVDALDVIVHIFYPETRNFYALEEMWNNQPAKSAKSESAENGEDEDFEESDA